MFRDRDRYCDRDDQVVVTRAQHCNDIASHELLRVSLGSTSHSIYSREALVMAAFPASIVNIVLSFLRAYTSRQ
jgi:hypothetical protein